MLGGSQGTLDGTLDGGMVYDVSANDPGTVREHEDAWYWYVSSLDRSSECFTAIPACI